MLYGHTNVPTEFTLMSTGRYEGIFNEVDVDVIFSAPDGRELRVPAFWAGDNRFRVRFAAVEPGRYSYCTECNCADDEGLHGQEGELEVLPYEGDAYLYQHGRLQIASNHRTLEHQDGTPFFWLGDTWWYGLVGEFRWPDEFQELVADRVNKGFNLIQIVVGYVPATVEGDLRAGNEAGLPWGADYQTINPGYFDLADLRIDHLVGNGLVPCILSMWGNWLVRLGVENVKRHWRYLIARYGAYPVVWGLCGEVQLFYPDFAAELTDPQRAKEQLGKDWSEVCRYLGETDPYGHPLTAHPDGETESRDMLDEDVPLTVSMLQTGHGLRTMPGMLELIERTRARQPRMPVINAECVYEGILGSSWQDVQRFALWSCVLAGTAGHTYGAAEGCWQIHHRGQEPFPFTSGVWGEFEDWRDVASFPGSGQMQYARQLMERYPWWKFAPHSDWMELKLVDGASGNCFVAHMAGIPATVRVLYLPPPSYGEGHLVAVIGLEADVSYRAYFYDPRSGAEHEIGRVAAEQGRWKPPGTPSMQDWVIVLEAHGAR